MSKKLDRLVAIHVMGMSPAVVDAMALGPPAYSTNMAYNSVLDQMKNEGRPWSVSYPAPEGYACCIQGIAYIGNGPTAAIAVCVAALRVRGVPNNEIQNALTLG